MSPRVLARFTALAVLATQALANPIVVGHRGTGSDSGSNPYPENSLPSIRAAFEEGADLVEIDVQLAKDGTVIVWHDDTVPTEQGDVRTSQLMPDEFPQLVGPTGISAKVPSFREALRLALDLGIRAQVMDVELKIVDEGERQALVAAVAQVLREERASRKVIVTTFDEVALKLLEGSMPGIQTGLLGVFKGSTLRAAKKLAAQGYPVEFVIPSRWAPWSVQGAELARTRGESAGVMVQLAERQVGTWASFIEKVHTAGFRAGVWTVNSEGQIRDKVEEGYDMLITDEPDVARRVVPPPNFFLPVSE